MPFRTARALVDALPSSMQRLLSGAAWLAAAGVLGQGSMLIAAILVANALGVQEYGRFTLLQTTLVLVAGVAQMSFAVVISQQVSRYRDSDPATAGRIAGLCFLFTLSMGAVLALGLLAARNVLASDAFRDPALATGIAVIATAVPIVAVSAVQQGLFNGLERFREQALVATILVPVVIGAPYLGAREYGLLGALVGLAGAFAARFVMAQVFLFRIFRSEGLAWSVDFSWQRVRRLLNYSAPATLAGLAMWLAIWGGQTLLARDPRSEVQLGLFNASYMIRTIVIFIPQQAVLALLPLITRNATNYDQRGAHRMLLMSAKIVFGFSIVMAIVAGLCAEVILGLFGERFIDGRQIFLLLLLSAPLESLTITLYQGLQSQARFWSLFLWINAPLALCVLISAAILIPDHLALGLAGAWLVGWTLALTLTTVVMGPLRSYRC